MSREDSERVELVIGAASGIGWAVAKGLAAAGRRVTIADLNATGAAARADDLGPPHAGAGIDFERMMSSTDERLCEEENAT